MRIEVYVCGICGIVKEEHGEAEELLRRVERMVSTLAHRGPDHAAVRAAGPGVVLGHARLSILDLSPTGHQPMQDATGRVMLCCNGEIYNYQKRCV